MRRDVFQAIADPVRRGIIDLLAEEKLTVNTIADKFEISRPAISKHIKILNECDLIIITQHGRERFCQIKPESLFEIADWASKYRKLWEDKLDSFENYITKLQSDNTKK
ncbi:MAG: metalloregulator ArsR/SmtB family transcription factor [Cyclobacteriaceae bacterium]